MHDPRLKYIYMSKHWLLQCMHEAASKHVTPSISPVSLHCKRKRGFNFIEPLWYGRNWPWSHNITGFFPAKRQNFPRNSTTRFRRSTIVYNASVTEA
jgi:hypothetical protein